MVELCKVQRSKCFNGLREKSVQCQNHTKGSNSVPRNKWSMTTFDKGSYVSLSFLVACLLYYRCVRTVRLLLDIFLWWSCRACFSWSEVHVSNCPRPNLHAFTLHVRLTVYCTCLATLEGNLTGSDERHHYHLQLTLRDGFVFRDHNNLNRAPITYQGLVI